LFFSGLKGQYNPVQGIVSGGKDRNNALGKVNAPKPVRANMIIKAKNPSRTELILPFPIEGVLSFSSEIRIDL
jgi:hypothetical protein